MIDRTFFIDSNNISDIKSRLYGYMVTDDGELYLDKIPKSKTSSGLFCLIEKHNNHIRVSQDFCGSFGIYLYQNNNYFAISNSFFKLLENISYGFSINYHFVKTLFYAEDVPIVHNETLVNEIKKLDSNDVIDIDLDTYSINISKVQYRYFKKKLNSRETFELLDKWYFKWVKVFRSIIKKNYPVSADLSGGLDTRVILSMLRTGNIDINNSVRLISHKKINLEKDSEDLKIAKIISKDLNLKLNEDNAFTEIKNGSFSANDSYISCKYTSFTSSNMIKYNKKIYETPLFSIKGIGSTTKGICWKSIDSFINEISGNYNCYFDSNNIFKNMLNKIEIRKQKKYYKKVVKELLSWYKDSKDHKATLLFKYLMIENVDAKKALERLNANEIVISPFFDPIINEIDYISDYGDKLFLNTVILDRYDNCLLNYEIENRFFSKKSINLAHKLNNMYPLKKTRYPFLSNNKTIIYKKTLDTLELVNYLESIWENDNFKNVIQNYLGYNVYEKVLSNLDKKRINLLPQPINIFLTIYELDCLFNK